MHERDKNEDVVLSVFPDGRRVEVDMSLPQYEVLSRVAEQEEGETLIALAERDPVAAYQFVRRCMKGLASGITAVSINEQMVAKRDRDGEQVTSDLAIDAITDRMPAEYEGPFEFSLGVYPTTIDKELFGDIERIPVLDMEVAAY